MTPADERIVQLLAKWRKSLELHLRHTKLPDDEYWRVQAWPEHERPNRLIVELAMQRLEALQRIVQARLSAGDPSLSEALELMSFLSNLVGSEHLERRIPQAEDPAAPAVAAPAAPPPAPVAQAQGAAAAPPSASPEDEVLTDAVRLLSWGKAWHELPEAIERMADRPNATAVRKILKSARDEIERRVNEELGKE